MSVMSRADQHDLEFPPGDLRPDRPVAEVFAAVRSFARRWAADDRQRQLLETAIAGLEPHARRSEPVFFVELPLLVYGAIRGDARPAMPLAAATTLLFLGADIFDDLADGDRPAHWDGHSPAEINLAAANLLCALTPLALAELPASAERIVAMQTTLTKGLLRMSAGQQSDLAAHRRSQVGVADIESAVAGKSGEELAIFAMLAAQFAAASAEQVEHYAMVGRALGTGAQLASDCYELFTDPESRDLAHGATTLPIALQCECLRGAERNAFEMLLTRARTEEAARAEIRRQLMASGALRHCAFIVETYRQRALRMLAAAEPREPAAGELRALIGRISFFLAKPALQPMKETSSCGRT
jgi:geranylgeranyl pyrophosphate synthase